LGHSGTNSGFYDIRVLRVVDAGRNPPKQLPLLPPTLPPLTAKRPDPFDPANLRLDQSFRRQRLLSRKLLIGRCRFGDRISRISSSSRRSGVPDAVCVIELKEAGNYLLTPAISRELPGEFFIANNLPR